MTPEKRQQLIISLQLDQVRAQVGLLKRLALNSGYCREDLQRQIIGPCDTFVKAIDRVEIEELGVPGLQPAAVRRRA